jgi:hypothetical protein
LSRTRSCYVFDGIINPDRFRQKSAYFPGPSLSNRIDIAQSFIRPVEAWTSMEEIKFNNKDETSMRAEQNSNRLATLLATLCGIRL